jgi:3-oxoacyl-[acyl-carrier-protein] synthase-3
VDFPAAYLSAPAVLLPGRPLDNDEVLQRIRANFRGDERSWSEIERSARFVLDRCNTRTRYLEESPDARVGDRAAEVAQACLQRHGVDAAEIDLLINGSIARQYFEPATAMEVAAKLGLREVHAFDVTSACVGQLEAVHIACAYFALYPEMSTALVVAAELTKQFLAFDVQSPEDLTLKVAGLTIGNAATAWLVRRQPLPGGCLEIQGMRNYSLPRHWELCQAPIDGTFASDSHELFKLNVKVAPELARMIAAVGWSVDQVDHFVFHQPSEQMIDKVLTDLGADPARGLKTHHLYGNTASTTVALAMHEVLAQREVRAGDRMILSSAAAGFSMVSAAGTWVG